jgi:hypothetical protein
MARYQGKNYWLNNFAPCNIVIYNVNRTEKLVAVSVESAYHALRSTDPQERKQMAEMHPLEAKRYAYKHQLPARADSVKVMKQLLNQKFADPELQDMLIRCPDNMFTFHNTWHDNLWGVCTCKDPMCMARTKHNHLGRLLKELKYEFIEKRDSINMEPKKVQPQQEEMSISEQITGKKEKPAAKKKKPAKKRTTKKKATTKKAKEA